jgi:hypothetical protein
MTSTPQHRSVVFNSITCSLEIRKRCGAVPWGISFGHGMQFLTDVFCFFFNTLTYHFLPFRSNNLHQTNTVWCLCHHTSLLGFVDFQRKIYDFVNRSLTFFLHDWETTDYANTTRWQFNGNFLAIQNGGRFTDSTFLTLITFKFL